MDFSELNAAHWVWPQGCGAHANQYVEFRQVFTSASEGELTLQLAAGSRYGLWLNDQFIGAGPFEDWPLRLSVDAWQASAQAGQNELRILLHWAGVDTASSVADRPGLAFAVAMGEQCLVSSGATTQWRSSPHYRTEGLPRITPQLGFTFDYDAASRCVHEWKMATKADFQAITEGGYQLYPRPFPPIPLEGRKDWTLIAQGVFRVPEQAVDHPLGWRMQRDWLSARPAHDILEVAEEGQEVWCIRPVEDQADGTYLILDHGSLCCGYLEIEITAPEGTCLEIGWGEHLEDMRVRTHVGERCFAVRYRCREGRQVYLNPITRIGTRYLQVHVSGARSEISIHYVGIRKCRYPVETAGSFRSSNTLEERIYGMSVETLKSCMGDHYEDSPWREQALYANDMLNQSLAGYFAFGNYAYARASIRLLAGGLQEDGFLELCAPGRTAITIPSFSFSWILALGKHYLFSGDRTFLEEQFACMERILDASVARAREGLLASPQGARYWHFYDWAEGGLSGVADPSATNFYELNHVRYDAPLNAFFVLALETGVWLAQCLEKNEQAERWRAAMLNLRSAFDACFAEESRMCYISFSDESGGEGVYSVLVQALALLAGCCRSDWKADLRRKLLQPDERFIAPTLSQSLYVLEASIQGSEEVDAAFDYISELWGQMVSQGATTCWETIDGAGAFSGAGSLCHGWSAVPPYFYGAYLLGVRPIKPGFAEFEVGPGVRSGVSGHIPTPHGPIQISWRQVGDALVPSVDAPAACRRI